MYRLVSFIFAVAVLFGLVISGGILIPDDLSAKTSKNGADVIARSEQELQSKADQELADIDAAAGKSMNHPALSLPPKSSLTAESAEIAAQKAGDDAYAAALRTGQSAEQALKAKIYAQKQVEQHMERRLSMQQSGT